MIDKIIIVSDEKLHSQIIDTRSTHTYYYIMILSWIRQNKLSAGLLLVLVVILLRSLVNNFGGLGSTGRVNQMAIPTTGGIAAPESLQISKTSDTGLDYIPSEAVPAPQIQNRLVIENSHSSLLVKDVVGVKNKIIDYAKDKGGYMVDATVNNPQDAPTATLTVRLPSDQLDNALNFFHSLAVKVVSEYLQGTDVTDQYVDVEKRIALLETTKTRFTEILSQAKEISDVTNLNQQIINIQSQIDSLKGQQQALEKNAQLAKLTIYLSTDEIALPYAPSETLRPSVIFKLAVRSLVGHLRGLATSLIWVGVYAVIWVPLLICAVLIYRRFSHKAIK